MITHKHLPKILRVFQSCKTYAQWNIAYEWSDRLRNRMSNEVFRELVYLRIDIFNRIKLGL